MSADDVSNLPLKDWTAQSRLHAAGRLEAVGADVVKHDLKRREILVPEQVDEELPGEDGGPGTEEDDPWHDWQDQLIRVRRATNRSLLVYSNHLI